MRTYLGRLEAHSSKNYGLGKWFALLWLICSWAQVLAFGAVSSVSMQAPSLSEGSTPNLSSPVHFQATAESDVEITGYVVYVDDQNVYQGALPYLDGWILLGPGAHTVYVKAWDSSGALASTAKYSLNITDFSPPTPPPNATRLNRLAEDSSAWTVDNDPGVGGKCNDGSIEDFDSLSDPNTQNSPDSPKKGLHLLVASKCQYDDSLFFRKEKIKPSPYDVDTNFLWDFWLYIPTTTRSESVQALEFDLFQAVKLDDGVHEFMFGSQCNYASNQWQLWLPQNGRLTWVNTGLSPCQFSTGTWHHATYFLQRVTDAGYQHIPHGFNPSTDTNTSLRFGTLTIDGTTMFLGGLSHSTVPSPAWSATLGIQHQLDSAMSGVSIEEYVDKESLIVW